MKKTAIIFLSCVLIICMVLFLYSLGLLQDEFNVPKIWQEVNELEKLINTANDTVNWKGSVYSIEEANRGLTEGKEMLFRYVLFSQVIPIVIILTSGFSIFLIITWKYRCPKCKKMLALIKGVPIATNDTTVERDVVTSDFVSTNTGKVIKTKYATKDFKVSVHKIPYKCKYCPYTKYETIYGGL